MMLLLLLVSICNMGVLESIIMFFLTLKLLLFQNRLRNWTWQNNSRRLQNIFGSRRMYFTILNAFLSCSICAIYRVIWVQSVSWIQINNCGCASKCLSICGALWVLARIIDMSSRLFALHIIKISSICHRSLKTFGTWTISIVRWDCNHLQRTIS